MKVNYTVPSGRISVELEGNEQKEIFEKMAAFYEVFGESTCKSCNSENIYPLVRVVDDNTFYEMGCKDCGAKLAYGAHKKGGSLFPKRKNEDGTFDNKTLGWHKYKKKSNDS